MKRFELTEVKLLLQVDVLEEGDFNEAIGVSKSEYRAAHDKWMDIIQHTEIQNGVSVMHDLFEYLSDPTTTESAKRAMFCYIINDAVQFRIEDSNPFAALVAWMGGNGEEDLV